MADNGFDQDVGMLLNRLHRMRIFHRVIGLERGIEIRNLRRLIARSMTSRNARVDDVK